MSTLQNKRILLGVSGSIAAYKAVDLVRRLREAGAEVRVVLTRGVEQFVTPLTFQAVSGQPVRNALFDAAAEAAMGHIELARWADLVLIAPASANVMARLAQGQADDLLATLCLATTAPVVLAPAMNQVMWSHPATQANRALLAERGVRFIGPDSGTQACGETGAGRMTEPADIVQQLAALLGPKPLAGRTVLVTAGPTLEDLDPVRFIGNRSSGKMGYAVAQAAAEAGARVILVSGPVALPCPAGVERHAVRSAREMYDRVMAHVGQADIFIGAAAVADYAPVAVAEQKIKKSEEVMTLELRRNPDILANVAALPRRPFTVGFAAETTQVEQHARAKLVAKRLDMICANHVGVPGQGFESEQNALTVLWTEGQCDLALEHKRDVARALIELVAQRFEETTSPG